MSTSPTIHDLAPRLHHLMTILGQIPEISREGFLAIAEQMGNFSGIFATGASRAFSFRERILSPDQLGLSPLRSDLRTLTRESSSAFDSVTALMAAKESFSQLIGEIIDWGVTLEQEAFLPPLADQIKIKGGEGVELQTMGSIVDNLMQQIRPLLHEVVTTCQQSGEVMDHLSRRIHADLESSRHGLALLKKNSTSSLRQMADDLQRIGEACQAMEQRTQPVSAVVFAMVQAMQYDDITSQRLEHILQFLRLAQEKVQQPEQDRDTSRWLALALRIAIDQAEESCADLVTAIQSVHHHLTQISDQAVEQSRQINGMRKNSLSFRQANANVAYHLGMLLRFGLFDDSLTSEVLRALSQSENGLFQAKRAINVLMMTAKRLNALCNSIRTHGNGRLEILVATITEIAQRLNKEGPEKGKLLDGAAAQLHGMGLDYAEKVTPRLMRTSSLLRRIPLSSQQAESNISDLATTMSETLGETQATNVQIHLLAAELTFHMVIKRLMDQVIAELHQILEQTGLAQLTMEGDLHHLAAEFSDLAALYTMESERRVHQAVLNQDGANNTESAPEDDGFELF